MTEKIKYDMVWYYPCLGRLGIMHSYPAKRLGRLILTTASDMVSCADCYAVAIKRAA